jgi:iron complex transport system ATP-binding protein
VAAATPVGGLGVTAAVVRAEDIGVVLGGRRVLDGVSLEIVPGEVLALAGPNGAGKSTLLAVLSGEIPPTDGRATLGGRELASFPPLELARLRAVLTQDTGLSFPFLVAEVVEMGRSPWARTPKLEDDDRALAAAMARADVTHLARRRFTELSGGERARVSFARVLAQETPIVFLDEPTASLDLRHQEDVLRIARELAAEGRAVVIVLHDLSLAGAAADRVALLAGGRRVALGPPADVLTQAVIASVYGVPVDVLVRDGRPLVIPRRLPAG